MSDGETVETGRWWIQPRMLRMLAVTVGLLGPVLPGVVAKWLTEAAPTPKGPGLGPLRPEMVVVDAGTYAIGSLEAEEGQDDDKKQHRVTLTRSFAIAVTEVTQEQYERVLGMNPSSDKVCGLSCPVTNVSWFDAVAYLNELSQRDPNVEPCYRGAGDSVEWIDGCMGYRLPTEAEWEIAARAETSEIAARAETSARYAGTDDDAEVCRYGNVFGALFACEDGYDGLAPAASFQRNDFFLYDMTGNVREWTWDWYEAEYEVEVQDPRGPPSGQSRVYRGGSFIDIPRFSQVVYRGGGEPSGRSAYLGFRVARSLP